MEGRGEELERKWEGDGGMTGYQTYNSQQVPFYIYFYYFTAAAQRIGEA